MFSDTKNGLTSGYSGPTAVSSLVADEDRSEADRSPAEVEDMTAGLVDHCSYAVVLDMTVAGRFGLVVTGRRNPLRLEWWSGHLIVSAYAVL